MYVAHLLLYAHSNSQFFSLRTTVLFLSCLCMIIYYSVRQKMHYLIFAITLSYLAILE